MKGRLSALFARRTRTMKRCSFDARSHRAPQATLYEE